MAAPAELRNAQHAPSDEIAPRECGWKHGDSGYSAGQELCRKEPRIHYEPRIPLTPTGLLMEAHFTFNLVHAICRPVAGVTAIFHQSCAAVLTRSILHFASDELECG